RRRYTVVCVECPLPVLLEAKMLSENPTVASSESSEPSASPSESAAASAAQSDATEPSSPVTEPVMEPVMEPVTEPIEPVGLAPQVSAEQERAIVLMGSGRSMAETAREAGVGRATL